MRMKKKKKFKKFEAIPNQTSFGGSLGFGSGSADSSLTNPVGPPRPSGNFIWDVDFINQSTVVSDAEMTQGVAAFQDQINNDFLPAWSIGANLNIVTAPRGNALIYILDTTSD